MSRILRRPMFRGGPVDSRGSGITSGLMDKPKRGLVNEPGGYSGELITRRARARIRGPQDLPNTTFGSIFDANFQSPILNRPRIRGPQDFLKGSSIEDAEGLLADASGATLPTENLGSLEFGLADEIREEGPKLGVGSDFDKDLDERYLVDEPERDTGLEAIRQKNIDEMDSSPTVVKTPKPSDDEPEVTMTDLEKALGLDSARQEYAADALAAASKAFFEGRGFEAIGDAAAVKSKAPDIKRLAGLEEFKADRAEKLYEKKLDAQARLKQGTMGNLQKDILFLRGLTGADRIAALGKLGYKAPSLSAAIKELKITGQAPDAATIINLAELYIGPDFKGIVDVTEELSTKPAGTYIANDASALVIIDEQGKSRLQKL